MSFFTELATAVASNLLSAMTSSMNVDPMKVLEISSSSLTSRSIWQRSQCLIIYGPVGESQPFELVLNLPIQMHRDKVYSLCRGTEESVRLHFELSHEKLPLLYEICPEMCMLPRLNDLWPVIVANPSWTAAHVIAHYGIQDGLKNSTIFNFIGIKEEVHGMNPLHVAAKSGRAEFLRCLVSLTPDVRFDDTDNKGNSLFHYAAQSNKETVEVLPQFPMGDVINQANAEGQTPLHIACLSDRPECVKALIAAGANINLAGQDQAMAAQANAVQASVTSPNTASAKEILTEYPNQLHTKDMKRGGTPLHWATTKELVSTLVELGCQVDARNFRGETALHVMVQRDRFECVVFLLAHGADPNLIDADSNAPLHLAVQNAQLTIVQALVAFGANVDLTNSKGDSPRHLATRRNNLSRVLYVLHSVGAKRCAQKTPKCGEGCRPGGKDDGRGIEVEIIPRSRHLFDDMLNAVCQNSAGGASQSKRATKGGRLLCLDGGGIRGLVLVQLLEALERLLGEPVLNHFDWVAGTSTGGILALALACGKTLAECKSLYFRFKDRVFVGKRPYDEVALERFLRTEFGERTMGDLNNGPRLLITAVLADTIPSDLHFFRNYTPPQELLSLPDTGSRHRPESQLVWQAARASGAAPTYFRAYGSFLDGGLSSNNPTLDALTEIQEYGAVMNALGAGDEVVRPSVVVSLGTGTKPAETVDTLDLFRPESLLDTARLAFGVSAFGKLLVEQVTSTDRRVVDRSRSWCMMAGAAYFRLSPQLTFDVGLDETRDEFLVQMLWETQAFIFNNQAQLRKIAQLIRSG